MDLNKLEGLSIDEKYEIEEYREMMKAFAAAAAEGDLDQVSGGPRPPVMFRDCVVAALAGGGGGH